MYTSQGVLCNVVPNVIRPCAGGNIMNAIHAIVSFVVVFVIVFVLAGWFLMPFLPPFSDHLISAFEIDYWYTNWIGVLLGLLFGYFSARSTIRKLGRK